MAAAESPSLDFGFGFNDVNFSDRILRIEVLSEPDDNNRKRRRIDPHDRSSVVVIDDSPMHEATVNQPSDEVHKDNEGGVKVRILHITSLILAAKSPFFHKMFSNGMRESEQRHVTLKIQASEEAAVMDMLKFMYSNTLPRTTPAALLNVLMVADKFEVESCIRYCSQLLRTLPMTCESAFLYLDLPSTVLMADTQLRDAAKSFLRDRFKDISKHEEEILNLPLAGLEAVLSSDDLQLSDEDDVYEFVLKWARHHYPNPKERREMLSKHILRLVRFPFMSLKSLKKVRTCSEIASEVASEVVMDALFFKGEAPHEQRALVEKDLDASFRQFVERPCRYRPLKVVECEKSYIAFVDFKREECLELSPPGRILSQAFQMGGQGFVLSGCCKMAAFNQLNTLINSQIMNLRRLNPLLMNTQDNQDVLAIRQMMNLDGVYGPGWNQCFELSLGMDGPGKEVGLTVDYEFAVRMKCSGEFVRMVEKKNVLIGGQVNNDSHVLLTAPWPKSMAENGPYFVNGVLHLQLEITVKK